MRIAPRSFGSAFSLLFLCFLVSSGSAALELPAQLLGAWASIGIPAEQLRLEPTRVVQLRDGTHKVWGIEGYEPGKLTVRFGVLATWKVSLEGDRLMLERGGQAQSYRRLAKIPAELQLDPATLGQSSVVQAARLEAVQKELAERIKKDQEVRMDPAKAAAMAEIDADNRRYIRSLVSELGWVDVDRFGPRASVNAFLLVQHSGDLRLMMAVLPLIEKDARRYPDYAQPYTLLYDRLQIDLGKKQRYGTQLDKDAAGNPFVLPLEDPARVDEFLKELKLPPLSDYLATASKYLYEGRAIRLPRPEE
jgi:hypothetical protein